MSKGLKFPLATIAAYGPDSTRATKLAVSVFTKPSQRDPAVLRRWFATSGDIRRDPTVLLEIDAFLKDEGVTRTVMSDGIIGCPHEEGVDYPLGESCPRCPFWATVDRWTGGPPPEGDLTAAEILAELAAVRTRQPLAALAAADRHRTALIEPLLDSMERVLDDPSRASDGEAQLLVYGAYLFSKWREPRAHRLIVRWLSLPNDQAHQLGGDTVTQDGRRFLASTCAGQVNAIKALILDRQADGFCRGEAIGALAVLAAWGDVSYDSVEEHLLWLAREGLEREPGAHWDCLALYCADIGAREVFPELRRAYAEELIDETLVGPSELEDAKGGPKGVSFRHFCEANGPITDVAEETKWWACFRREHRQQRSGPKVGRNDPCPCGSGRKYKKCCVDKQADL